MPPRQRGKSPSQAEDTAGSSAQLIFISWSGATSKSIARALYDWIPNVIQSAKPWMSDAEIDTGKRWSTEINAALDASNFGIVCLTPDNLSAEWILFEAGAIAKRLPAQLTPYLSDLKLSDVEPPLGMFQAATADEAGTRRLMESLNAAQGANALSLERLKIAFDKHWPDLANQLKKAPKPQTKKEQTLRPPSEVVGEILEIVRSISRRMPEDKPVAGAPQKRVDVYRDPSTGELFFEHVLPLKGTSREPVASTDKIVDLMEALKASLAKAGNGPPGDVKGRRSRPKPEK